jgi:hypothetical protein
VVVTEPVCVLPGNIVEEALAKVHGPQRRKRGKRDKVESNREPSLGKVTVRQGKVYCTWCGGHGCAACFNARERLAAKSQS